MSLGTVHNVWKKFVGTGEVTAKKQPLRESMRVLDHNELLVIGFREICQYLQHLV